MWIIYECLTNSHFKWCQFTSVGHHRVKNHFNLYKCTVFPQKQNNYFSIQTSCINQMCVTINSNHFCLINFNFSSVCENYSKKKKEKHFSQSTKSHIRMYTILRLLNCNKLYPCIFFSLSFFHYFVFCSFLFFIFRIFFFQYCLCMFAFIVDEKNAHILWSRNAL